MDLNLATTTIVNNNQENNQLLLNAIKNKFAAKTATEAAAFSPPKFNIPVLKIPGSENTTEIIDKKKPVQNPEGSPSTQLNKFLLKQLQEKHKISSINTNQAEFVLPNLQLSSKFPSNEETKPAFEIPVLKTVNTSVSNLTAALTKLQVNKNSKEIDTATKPQTPLKTSTIDLTLALASKLQSYQQPTPPTRDFKKPSKDLKCNDNLDFEIPFIDCDNIDISRKSAVLLSTSNEYCVIDISKLRLKHTLVEPSAIGRVLNSHDNKYTEPLPLKCFSTEFQQQNVKHTIEPFRFDTKSPDDLVMETLNKYQRRYHN